MFIEKEDKEDLSWTTKENFAWSSLFSINNDLYWYGICRYDNSSFRYSICSEGRLDKVLGYSYSIQLGKIFCKQHYNEI